MSKAVCVILLFSCIVSVSSVTVLALSGEQKLIFDQGINYFDAESCGAFATSTGAATHTDAEGSADAKANALVIYTFLTSHGLTKPQAGGILANLYYESAGLNPKKVQNGGDAEEITVDNFTGYGLAQWTSRNRQQGLKDLAASRNKKSSNLGLQIDYLWKELTGGYKQALSNLKKTTDYSSAIYVIINQFEAPQDRNQVQSRGDAFKSIYDSLPEAASAADSSASSASGDTSGVQNCMCPAPSADPAGSNGKTVAIDPGHGPSAVTVDSKTGLKQVETNNQPEGKNVWDVAQLVKKSLEADGYKVVMLKQTEDESVTFRQRAERADQANADIALSIHTDSTLGNDGQIYPQKVGLYRGSGANKTTFTDAKTAETSQKYSDIFKSERQKTEGSDIVVKYNDFNGRQGYEPGDIQMVQLFSKTPWIYNEAKSSDVAKYAKGLISGVEKSLGQSGDTLSTQADATTCANGGVSSGNGSIDDIYATALKYAWSDYTNPNPTPKPSYKFAYDSGKRKGDYPGGGYTDCGAFITRLMIDSGADPNYNSKKLATSGQITQLNTDSKYEKIGNVTNVGQLKPGDIAVSDSHTYMYVGKHAGLKSQYDSVSASLAVSSPGRTPMASNSYDLGSWHWYRLKSIN
ncbi:MAG: phage tail tip lysozyme [Patescibacteria group bacterium]|nr:phage tail tip lysozyme [Patescibacteria group bacterium]